MTCDDVRIAVLQGRTLDPERAAHLTTCPSCSEEHAGMRALGVRLRTHAPEPPTALTSQLLAAAAPALAANATRVGWRPLVRALAAALLPLPLIVATSAYALQTLYRLLATVLPETLSFYLVLNYAGLLALLAALTYGAIPLLAARQARPSTEVAHG